MMAFARDSEEKPDLTFYKIESQATFDKVTGVDRVAGRVEADRSMAAAYFFAMTDVLNRLAFKVSEKFIHYPQLFQDLSTPQGDADKTPRLLGDLWTMYGTDPKYLSQEQRDQIYLALFGPANDPNDVGDSSDTGPGENWSAGGYDFKTLSGHMQLAAIKLSEQVFTTGELMLRDAVRRAHELFKEFLRGKAGASLRWSKNDALAILAKDTVYPILRNGGVAAVFGIHPPPRAEWPYVLDAQGSKLVHAISSKLMRDEPEKTITEARFIDLQTTALRGAEALAAVIDFDEHEHEDHQFQDELIRMNYTWAMHLRGLQEGSVARWQEPLTYARDYYVTDGQPARVRVGRGRRRMPEPLSPAIPEPVSPAVPEPVSPP
jgi:hypothetical protein